MIDNDALPCLEFLVCMGHFDMVNELIILGDRVSNLSFLRTIRDKKTEKSFEISVFFFQAFNSILAYQNIACSVIPLIIIQATARNILLPQVPG